jgi:hypothetical protein
VAVIGRVWEVATYLAVPVATGLRLAISHDPEPATVPAFLAEVGRVLAIGRASLIALADRVTARASAIVRVAPGTARASLIALADRVTGRVSLIVPIALMVGLIVPTVRGSAIGLVVPGTGRSSIDPAATISTSGMTLISTARAGVGAVAGRITGTTM